MQLSFLKYQGTGNDFILVDNRDGKFSSLTRAQIAKICDRRFGVGADGLILLNAHPDYDFEMKNYNADGGECSMCGNGARTLVQFAQQLGLKPRTNEATYRFWGSDGEHAAFVKNDLVHLKMKDVLEVQATPAGFVLNTGSPHLVCPTTQLMTHDVVTEGRKLRNSPMFMPGGINVNFVEAFGQQIFVRTYERGVEDETLSCGTGIIASAIIFRAFLSPPQTSPPNSGAFDSAFPHPILTQVETRGGHLQVQFTQKSSAFTDIWLIGPAQPTFAGTFIIV
jgi:diaminopimelate epimerase